MPTMRRNGDRLDAAEDPMPANRLLWRCRRGMRELEELLIPFARTRYPTLDAEERRAFERLLDYPDPVLLEYTLGQALPRDRTLARLLREIRTAGP